ncbi:hypothetical protein PR003_g4451 [Phytophthora rubi]|uniref:Secreted protein n=1 Tax=Phytophthora rubi TaxID=129364 RepID=A0A6A4G543_9STRA|nr:hypothetical protein PR002_g4446 [Phytophthora rubi]KAE9049543.1 hypothetical protein PR001_g3229 [Phytophthora rubi]KAE9352330.1 hypothetical protein PR003_g4451 [Phytophthora rubi]
MRASKNASERLRCLIILCQASVVFALLMMRDTFRGGCGVQVVRVRADVSWIDGGCDGCFVDGMVCDFFMYIVVCLRNGG